MITKFENTVRRLLFKEYDKLRIVEDILHTVSEEKDGDTTATQFILAHTLGEKRQRQKLLNECIDRS